MNKYTFIFLTLLAVTSGKLCAQANDLKARIEYEEAEKAYSEDNYELALTKLANAKQLMGSWQSRISYLQMMCLDKSVDYLDWEKRHDQLKTEVGLYLNFTDKNPDKADMEKVRAVYVIEKKINELHRIKEWQEASEVKRGDEFNKNSDYTSAMSSYVTAAENGNGNAMFAIGLLYYNGKGVPKNNAEAMTWFKKAVDKGDYYSFPLIATIHLESQNYTEAMNSYKKAVDKGFTFAMYVVGMMYYKGLGTNQNYTEAMVWLRKVAEKGNANAMYMMGCMYYNGEGVTQNYTEAMNLFRKAAEKGDADAMNFIGHMYYNGIGITQNYTEAFNWYKKGAENGNVSAMWNLGSMYHSPQGAWNYTEAFKWFKKGAEKGHKKAMEQIAKMYQDGLGVKKDKALAKEWEAKAAQAKD